MKVMGVYRGKKGKGQYLGFFLGVMGLVLANTAINKANAYEEEAVRRGGTISGVVKYSGVIPSPEKFKVTMGSNPEFCGSLADEKGMIEVSPVRVSSEGRLADVVIFLQEVERGKPGVKTSPVITIDQCQFVPRVTGMMTGTTIRLDMRDPIVHQLRGWEMLDRGRLPLFHLPNLGKEEVKDIPLEARRSSIVKLECDQHRFMQSWLLLTANPYVTVSDARGVFTLTEVPAGEQTVGAWHPVLGYQEAKVILGPNQEKTLELAFSTVP